MSKTTFPYDFPGIFDLDGSNPQFPFTFPTVFGLVKARLDVTVTTTAVMGEAPQIRFDTAVEAVTSAAASVSTSASVNEVAVNATITAQALRTATVDAELSVTATLTAEALETGRGSADLAVDAVTSADASASYPAVAEFLAQGTASAEVIRDAVTGSSFPVYAMPAAFITNDAVSGSSSQIDVTVSAEALRTIHADSSLDVSTGQSGEALETGRGEGFLSVTASTEASGSVEYPFATDVLPVEATATAEAHRSANVDASTNAIISPRTQFPFAFPVAFGVDLNNMLRDARAESNLDVDATPDQTLAQGIVSYFNAEAIGSGTGYLFAPVDDVPTSVTADLPASGANLSRAQASTSADATVSSAIAKDAGVVSELAVQCSITAEIKNDAVSDATLNVDATSSAVGVENDAATFESAFVAVGTAESYKLSPADSNTDATATQSSSADREARADASQLNISHASSGVIAVPQRVDSFIDYFNSKDTSRWTWGESASVEDGRLVLACNAFGTGKVELSYSASTGTPWWKFSDSCAVSAQLVQPPNPGNGTTTTQLEIFKVGTGVGSIRVVWNDGQWKFYQTDESGTVGQETVVSYEDAGSWVRVKNDGSIVRWETSVDGVTWVGRKSEQISGSYAGCSINLFSNSGGEISPGSAIWDNFNVLPVQASASLSCNFTATSDSRRGQTADAALLVSIDPAAIGRYDGNASGNLSATASVDTVPLKILNGSVELSVTADSSTEALENDVADAEQSFTFTGTAEMSRSQNISAELPVTADADVFASRGQSIEAISIAAEASTSASAVNEAKVQASLWLNAYSEAAIRRGQFADAALEADASTTNGEVFSQEYADAFLAAQATASGTISIGKSISSNLSAIATSFSTAVREFFASASFAASVTGSGEVTEPREVVAVEPEYRISSVAAEVRLAFAPAVSRSASVPQAASRNSSVTSEVRSSSVTYEDRQVYVIAAERNSEVPAENLKVTT